MIDTPSDLYARQELVAALAVGDWATVLHAVSQETGASQSSLAAATGLSQPHISRIMLGRVAEPGIKTVRALCDGLNIPRSLAGLLDRDQELTTERRQVLGGALAVSGLALVGTAAGPVVIDHADDERLLTVLSATHRRLEHRVPSTLLIGPAVAHLVLVRQLRARAASPPAARRLAITASEAAGLVAWLYLDLDDRAGARRHYRLAVREATATGHPLLLAYMTASFGQFAATAGDPGEAGRLVAEARRSLPRSAPTIAHVWMDTIEASALAEFRDHRALALLDAAEQRLGKASQDEAVWPWLFRFDVPKLFGYRAVCEANLGRWQAAAKSFAAAGKYRSPKQQAVADVDRARVLAAQGDVEQACTVAADALRTGLQFGSERVVRAVGRFRAGLGTRAGSIPRGLDDQLHGVYTHDL